MNRRDALKAGLVLPLVSTANASEIPNGLKEIKFCGMHMVENVEELFEGVEPSDEYGSKDVLAWLPKDRALTDSYELNGEKFLYFGIVEVIQSPRRDGSYELFIECTDKSTRLYDYKGKNVFIGDDEEFGLTRFGYGLQRGTVNVVGGFCNKSNSSIDPYDC
jgi:hypothetical protein